jgi:hypothetical protein
MLKCNWAHTLSCRLMYCSFANIGHDLLLLLLPLLLSLLQALLLSSVHPARLGTTLQLNSDPHKLGPSQLNTCKILHLHC